MQITNFLGIWIGLVLMIQLSLCQLISNLDINMDQHCPVNQMKYLIDDKNNSWMCDCLPGFIYYSATATCHKAFTRGPCPKGHYIYLETNDSPSCMKNICLQESHIPYRGHCHEIGTEGGPCLKNQILKVNETSLQLECIQKISVETFYIIKTPKRRCPKGSLRDTIGMCRRTL